MNNIDEMILKVRVENVNDPPELKVRSGIYLCYEDERFSYQLNATDIDPTNDELTWSLIKAEDFVSLDPDTGILFGTPTNDDVGGYSIEFKVEDEHGASDTGSLDLLVENVNDPPMVSDPPIYMEMNEDTVHEIPDLNEWFDDIDSRLEFESVSDGNMTVEINGSKAALIPKHNWNGNTEIRIKCSDGEYSVEHTLWVKVEPVNDLPSLAEIVLQNGEYREGGIQIVTGIGDDPDLQDGDSLSYSWFSNVSGPLGQGNKINLSLLSGHHNITLTVSDRAGASTSTQISILVLPAHPVDIPDNDDGNITDPEEVSENYTIVVFILIGSLIITVLISSVIVFIILRSRSYRGPRDDEKSDMKENHEEDDDRGQGKVLHRADLQ
ncbi:MAG: Ig-like domain-containing protein [Thermoplasmatota archaeon]